MPRKRTDCPICGKPVECEPPAKSPHFPFCGKRCRMVDLDKWFEGDYRISEELADDASGGDEPG